MLCIQIYKKKNNKNNGLRHHICVEILKTSFLLLFCRIVSLPMVSCYIHMYINSRTNVYMHMDVC